MRRFILCALSLGGFALGFAGPHEQCGQCDPAPSVAPSANSEIVINVDDQQLRVVKSGMAVASFPISTSRFGLGDGFHSYKTPLGMLEVCDKVGDHLPIGAVLKGGRFTGEVLSPNAPGRDPIVTRIIRLQGLEAQNKHARERGIYIHGTPEEGRIGKPVSWGCIRMRSKDVVELYKRVEVGTKVIISTKGGSGAHAAPQEERERSSASSTSSGWWS